VIFPRKNPLTHYFEKLQNKKAVPIAFETASCKTILFTAVHFVIPYSTAIQTPVDLNHTVDFYEEP